MSSCLLAKLSNFCQLLLPMPFLTTFGSIWQLLATFVILLYCPLVILSSRHSVLFSSCQCGSLSICQLVNFLACELLSLWTFQIVHLGACELVLHITSMISFGGFLAECLPCCISPHYKMICPNCKKDCPNYTRWSWSGVPTPLSGDNSSPAGVKPGGGGQTIFWGPH